MASSFSILLITNTELCFQGRMTSILTFEQTEDKKVRPVLNDKAIIEILSQPQCKDIPFLVISINGIKRSGKSFLCNLIICYLRYLSKVSQLHIP